MQNMLFGDTCLVASVEKYRFTKTRHWTAPPGHPVPVKRPRRPIARRRQNKANDISFTSAAFAPRVADGRECEIVQETGIELLIVGLVLVSS